MAIDAPRPRLIASDLDGTLLRSDGMVSARTRRALIALTGVGIEIVFVTARPPRAVDHLADLAESHGIVICANGAFVYDVTRRQVVASHGLAPAVVAAIARDIRRELPGSAFAVELSGGILLERAYPPLHPEDLSSDVRHGSVDALDRPAGKLLARPTLDPGPDFIDRVRAIVGPRALVTHSGAGNLAEIGPLGVTKATALRDWCARRGIEAADVWAFGDMPNDVPMLTWAGRSYAVANAHPEAQAAAEYRCASNDDDGVAAVLESLSPRTSSSTASVINQPLHNT